MKRRVELQLRILKRMNPLVEKRQAGDGLSDDDRAWLKAAHKEVLEKLCK
jgi:gluconate kinase